MRLLTGDDLQFEGDNSRLSAPRPRALFVLLALHPGKAVSRDRLCDYLWPYVDQTTARRRLRMALMNMRRGLSEDVASGLRIEPECLALDIDPASVDMFQFIALAQEGDRQAQASAADLYGGDLLAQFPAISDKFDRFIGDRREDLRARILVALHGVMQAMLEAGDSKGFDAAYRKALEVDRANSDIALLAMAAAAKNRQAARVQEIYDSHAVAVQDSLGIRPSAAVCDARDRFLAEAGRERVSAASESRRKTPTAGLTEIRAKPRVVLDLSGRRRLVAAIAIGGLVSLAVALAGAVLWSRNLRPDTAEGEIFLVRPERSVSGDCATETDPGAFWQVLLGALQRFEGSNTVLGAVRRRLIGDGPGIFEVELALSCNGQAVRATISVVNTENRSVTWVGRYDTDPAGAQNLSEAIYTDLAAVLRP